jgi:hypothetical protein
MTVIEILQAAKAKIENPENWTTGYYAKDAAGEQVDAADATATCFCALGAVEVVTGTVHLGRAWPRKVENFLKEAAGGWVPDFNDAHPHTEVLGVFDKAIQLAQAEGEAQ